MKIRRNTNGDSRVATKIPTFSEFNDSNFEHCANVKDMMLNFAKDIKWQGENHDWTKVIEQLEEVEKDHPYKVIGQPDTYSQYNEAWQDCMDRVIGIVKRGGVEE